MTKEFAFDKYISDTFRSIGIMPNVKGYQYLSYAVKLVVDAGKMLKITREVYPEVAKHFCVTSVQ
ncbi:MAG: sporulation initiation factor Spo0A C-terminal domain-containing protein, partial [Firmicutes bacterium]|nr:sporulation initiation factor Spo0A C-terminal domain-containing protein [Bacillota bacterium]